jgi:hypothetical protein
MDVCIHATSIRCGLSKMGTTAQRGVQPSSPWGSHQSGARYQRCSQCSNPANATRKLILLGYINRRINCNIHGPSVLWNCKHHSMVSGVDTGGVEKRRRQLPKSSLASSRVIFSHFSVLYVLTINILHFEIFLKV